MIKIYLLAIGMFFAAYAFKTEGEPLSIPMAILGGALLDASFH